MGCKSGGSDGRGPVRDMASLSTHHVDGVFRLPLKAAFGGGAGCVSADLCMKHTDNGYSGRDQFTFSTFPAGFLSESQCVHTCGRNSAVPIDSNQLGAITRCKALGHTQR